MKEFNANVAPVVGSACAQAVHRTAHKPEAYGLYVGLDVHKDTIAVAVARPGRKAAEYRGEIANKPKNVEPAFMYAAKMH